MSINKLPLHGLLALALLQTGAPLLSRALDDPSWGLYASYVGTPPLWADPCNITYTIAPMDSPQIVANVKSGLMIPILEGVPRSEAQKGMRMYGRYFDNLPDGIVKKKPCGSGSAAGAPAGGSPGQPQGAGGCGAASLRDQVLTVAEARSGNGGGGDPYQTATVRTCIDPGRTLWIAWNDRPDTAALSASRPGQLLLGPGGAGTDDFIDVVVTSPSGQSQKVRMDQNDAFGASFGPQNLLFGRREEAPDVFRKVPFGLQAGQERFLDEEGAFNPLFTQAGEYSFMFQFRDNTGGTAGFGHPKIFLIVKHRGEAVPAWNSPAGLEEPPRLVLPAAARRNPGSHYRIRIRGEEFVTLYERGTDKDVPIDLYYWAVRSDDGSQAVQDGQKLWGRFVRKPSMDHPDQAKVQWIDVRWVWKDGRWKDVYTTEVPFEVLEEVR